MTIIRYGIHVVNSCHRRYLESWATLLTLCSFVTKAHVVWKVMKGVYMGRGEGVAVATVKTVRCEGSPLVSNL